MEGSERMNESKSFLERIRATRDGVRQHVEGGSATQNFEGVVEETIAVLGGADATEVVRVLRYQFRRLSASDLAELGGGVREHDERSHADVLAKTSWEEEPSTTVVRGRGDSLRSNRRRSAPWLRVVRARSDVVREPSAPDATSPASGATRR
jgi:hypothetical protein